MTFALARKTDPPSPAASQATLQQRAVGAYIGLAVGDALGATTEFMTPNEIRHEFGVHDQIRGGGWLRLNPGQVTDDTEMSLVLGESILQNNGVVAEQVAQAFSDWMRGKPIDIGNTVRRGIIHFRTSGSAQVKVNEYDAGNGACMRSLPLALYYHGKPEQEMIAASRLQSHVTHNNPIADAGTETVLRMLRAALNQAEKSQLEALGQELVELQDIYRFECAEVSNPSGWIVETLQVVFQAFFAHDSFEEILVDVVNRGGDADTTGAIAGMLAGALYGVEAIPQQWVFALDSRVARDCEAQALALLGD